MAGGPSVSFSRSRPRILIAGIWHETNTFAPLPTDLTAFRRYQFAEGTDLLARYKGTNTEIGGMIAEAEARDLLLVPALFAGAIPAGTVTRDAFEALSGSITRVARAEGPFDGVLLALHGAMVAEHEPEADAAVVERVRQIVGRSCPIVVTFDLHANLSQRLIDAADILVGYDTFPHVDMGARGREAAELLSDMIGTDRRPAKAFRKLPLVTVPQMQATAEPPMRAIMDRLFEIEREDAILTLSIAQGFAYADIDHLGVAVVGYGADASTLARGVDELADAIMAAREAFRPALAAVEHAIARALTSPSGPAVLVEPADNVGGGAPGDGTEILAGLLETNAPGTIVIWDPIAVATARDAGLGGRFAGPVGGRTLPALHGKPVPVEGEVTFLDEVTYHRDGPYMTGQRVPMGLVAIVRTAVGLKIVLTSERVMPFDATHLRVLGIDPSTEPILVAKSGSAWKAAFGDIAAAAITVDTGGVCSSNLDRLPYTRGPLKA